MIWNKRYVLTVVHTPSNLVERCACAVGGVTKELALMID